jgi:hypothetical protein
MRARRWMFVWAVAIFLAITGPAFAQDDEHGHGHGHDKDKHGDDRDHHGDDDQGYRGYHGDRGDRDDHFYRDHDRDEIRGWYRDHSDRLPPGLARRDRLPPGLETQLIIRGTLPPGLRKRIHDCPDDLERRLPPPPPDCANVLIGGHVVLVNRSSWLVVDIFHFEM